MRFRRIELRAFGPFTETSLELPLDEPLVHLIYGPNEAGKSSLLRGLGDFLFGIPPKTKDAHLHPYKDLRIAAELCFASGEVLDLVRRKGTKKTLQDATGEDREAELKRLLGPVDRQQFDGLFGLDHESLRLGADALIANRGDAGQSLFDAGSSSKGQDTSIKSVIDKLEEEAKQLFVEAGKKPTINLAMGQLREAGSELKRQSLSSDAWQAKQRELKEAEVERERLAAEIEGLSKRQRLLERHQRVAPLLLKHTQTLASLGELGELPDLAPGAADERKHNQTTLANQAPLIQRLRTKAEELRAELAGLVIPEDLLAFTDEAAGVLQGAADELRAAVQSQPAQAQELAKLQRELERELSQLEGIEEPWPVLTGPQRERVQRQIQERISLESNLSHAELKLSELARQLEAETSRLDALPAALSEQQAATLSSAIAKAHRFSEHEGSLPEALQQWEHEGQDLERELASLPLWSGSEAECLRLALPVEATLNHFREQAEAHERAVSQAEEEHQALAAKLQGSEQELRAESHAEELPSASKLDARRKQRDAEWQSIRAGEAADGPAGDALEASTLATDLLADRLRHEANRIERCERLARDVEALKASLAESDAKRQALREAQAALAKQWQAQWDELGIQARSPREMQSWCDGLRSIQARAGARLERQRDLAKLTESVRQCAQDLRSALEEAGQGCSEGTSLGVLDELAIARLKQHDQRQAQEASYREGQAETLRERDSAQAQHARAVSELERWGLEFEQAIDALGLHPPATNEEVQARLDALLRLEQLRGEADKLKAALARTEQLQADLDSRLASIGTGLAVSLEAGSALERTEEFLLLRRRALQSDERRSSLRAQLDEAETQLDQAESTSQAARKQLEQAIARAGVQHEDELPQVEERVDQKRALEAELQSLVGAIQNAGDHLGLAALQAEASALDSSEVQPELAKLEADLAQLDAERSAASERAGRAASELERMQTNNASELALERESHLASIQSASQRYLRLRMAARILREEVEAYRSQNQGPLLERTSQLFPVLTQGRYSEVRVEESDDGRPELLCLRGDDDPLSVEALSDGTRDQLYLALRIASIERHLEHGEPMPLVLDDILVHFDDERARIALGLLGELAQKTQVLFFTHHTRLRDLAREALGARLSEQQLQLA